MNYSKIINKLKNKEKIPLYGNGENIRDWIYVKDHVNALINVLLDGIVGKQYLIGGNNEISNIQLIHSIVAAYENITNQKVDWEWFEYVADRKGHDFRYAIDDSKLNQLGFRESIQFENGIIGTIKWYESNKNWWSIGKF